MGMSTFYKAQVINYFLRNAWENQASEIYLALYIGDPEAAGVEVSGAGYARLNMPYRWTTPVDGATDNVDLFTFTATADWGEVTHLGVHDATTGGNAFIYGALDIAQTINNGDSLEFAIGAIDFVLAGGMDSSFRNKTINYFLQNAWENQAGELYLALYIGDPEVAGVEVSGAGYARQNMPSKFTVPVAGVASNVDVLTFTATADWGEVTHVGVHDATTGGDTYATGPMDAQTVNNGDSVVFAANEAEFTLS